MDEETDGVLYVRNISTNISEVTNKGVRISLQGKKLRLDSRDSNPTERDLYGKLRPKSLQKFCSEFVVRNLHLVDSFKGYPSFIAENLFLDAATRGRFNFSDQCSIQNLNLFVDAFFDDVCFSAINCRGFPKLFDDIPWTHVKLLLGSRLTKLDLSSCRLYDKHEIFSMFQHFSNLTYINVADNLLSSDAIRFLTMSVRMRQKGATNLRYLNISGNRFLTYDAIPFVLKSFKHLECLDISQTLIEVSHCSALVQYGFYQDNNCSHFDDEIATVGWAKSLLPVWKKNLSQNNSASRFYGKLKKVVPPNTETATNSVLIFHKTTNDTACCFNNKNMKRMKLL